MSSFISFWVFSDFIIISLQIRTTTTWRNNNHFLFLFNSQDPITTWREDRLHHVFILMQTPALVFTTTMDSRVLHIRLCWETIITISLSSRDSCLLLQSGVGARACVAHTASIGTASWRIFALGTRSAKLRRSLTRGRHRVAMQLCCTLRCNSVLAVVSRRWWPTSTAPGFDISSTSLQAGVVATYASIFGANVSPYAR